MNKISDSILEEIQNCCDIAEIVSGYIPLKKAGRNFKANCPFHHEKTASFVVSPDKQIFHCFGCGAGGDVFSFIMKQERMDFPEAVRFLGEKVGVVVKKEENPSYPQAGSFTGSLYIVNELAEKYFQQNLLKPGDSLAELAMNYLENRGLNKTALECFNLGLAVDKWDGLLNFLQKNGISQELMLKSGLVVKNANGKVFDCFRNRIMFPICNSQGKRIGFGGRIWNTVSGVNSANQPKYINSPETEVYKKSKNLYGFNQSKKFIIDKDYCIVVEGYLDVIVPFEAGIKNIVASCGTAFTSDHARILKRYTHNLVIVFDSDPAGQEATLRSLDLLIEEGLNVKIAKLESGYDPDSYVRKYGGIKFQNLVDNASSLFDYKLNLLCLKLNKLVPEEKAKIAASMLETINKIKDAILRSSYIKKLSESLMVKEELLFSELKKIKSFPTGGVDISKVSIPKIYKMSKVAEKMLMSLMFEDGGFIKDLKQIVDYDEFSDPIAKKIVRHLYEQDLSECNPIELFKQIGDTQINSFICNLLVSDMGIDNKKKSFEDCVRKIKKDKIQLQLDALHQQINRLKQSESQELMSLLKQYNELKKEQNAYETVAKKES
ncbi:MAG: DNA primase [Candidatus Omnitrophica bacterium]|nr:DNA primase [Candidatus Omnitrophota bacterium]